MVSEIDRRGYYQGFERVYGCYPGGLGALAGGFQYSEGFSVSPSAGYRRPASQRLAGGSSSVQRVGFGAVAGRVGMVELYYPLASSAKIGGGPCSVAASLYTCLCEVGFLLLWLV